MKLKHAQLIAEAVAVICPCCGEEQPNKDGSLMWTPEDFRGNERMACVACDTPLIIAHMSKAQFPPPPL